MTDARFQDLAELLAAQLQNCEELCRLESEKQTVLLGRDVAALEKITRSEQGLAKTATELETQRLALAREIIGPEDTPSGDRILAQAALSGGAATETLRELREKLIVAAAALRELNESNARLIEQELRQIDFTIQAIAAGGSGERTYNATGTGVAGAGSNLNLYDRQV